MVNVAVQPPDSQQMKQVKPESEKYQEANQAE